MLEYLYGHDLNRIVVRAGGRTASVLRQPGTDKYRVIKYETGPSVGVTEKKTVEGLSAEEAVSEVSDWIGASKEWIVENTNFASITDGLL